MTIEEWTTDMMLVAFMRPNPNRYIKQEARKALKGWAKREDKTTKEILKLIIRAKQRGLLLRETYRNLTTQKTAHDTTQKMLKMQRNKAI